MTKNDTTPAKKRPPKNSSISLGWIITSLVIGMGAVAVTALWFSKNETAENFAKFVHSKWALFTQKQVSTEFPPVSSTPEVTQYPGKLLVFAAGHCIKKTASTSSHECGEDAFSIAVAPGAPSKGRTFLGVADGVGGWGLSGGDSSKVSTGILEEMKGLASGTRLPLSEVAGLAFERMAAQRVHKQGSTTLCTAILDHESGRLDISNIGDSGALIIRDGKLLRKTKLGVEGFNAPHQVGFDQEGNPYGSIQQFESRQSVFLRSGDMIVMVTDGVLDNLYEQEIVDMVVAMVGPVANRSATKMVSNIQSLDAALQERVKSASTTLAWHSWARSNEVHWKSPFALSALSHGYMFSGGYIL
ncbi:Protein phosphatase 2C (PP2C)-like domain-containing protein [Paramicrosporidium saccamoebae]|uniref:Protein phosphatase n=1 Tax=Paramicrosporidium saccamoebae TaxID=1246581 RepID=A0A2H9TGB0_9FUNG|nr:Protein phosphatase 2C (PP2C)-like domain-containing protein [Paramicrosporidium saccamoebae]